MPRETAITASEMNAIKSAQQAREAITLEMILAGAEDVRSQEVASIAPATIDRIYEFVQNILRQNEASFDFGDNPVAAMEALNFLHRSFTDLDLHVLHAQEQIALLFRNKEQYQLPSASTDKARELLAELFPTIKTKIKLITALTAQQINAVINKYPNRRDLANYIPIKLTQPEGTTTDSKETSKSTEKPVSGLLAEILSRFPAEKAIDVILALLFSYIFQLGNYNEPSANAHISALVEQTNGLSINSLNEIVSSLNNITSILDENFPSLDSLIANLETFSASELKSNLTAKEVNDDEPVDVTVKFREESELNNELSPNFIDFTVITDGQEQPITLNKFSLKDVLSQYPEFQSYDLTNHDLKLDWNENTRQLNIFLQDSTGRWVNVAQLDILSVVKDTNGRIYLRAEDMAKDSNITVIKFMGNFEPASTDTAGTDNEQSDDEEPTEPSIETAEVFVVGPSGANVRAAASSANTVEIKVRASGGDFLQIIDEVEGAAVGGNTTWYQVVTANGVVGYVSATTGEVQEVEITTEEDLTPEVGEPPTPNSNGNETPPADGTEAAATDVPSGTVETVVLNGETIELTATPEGYSEEDQVSESDLATEEWQTAIARVTNVSLIFDENHHAYVVGQGGLAARVFFANEGHTQVIAFDGDEVVFELEMNAVPVEFSGPTSITVNGREISVLTSTDITEIDGVEIGWGYNDVEMPLDGEYRSDVPRASNENGNFWNVAFVKGIYLSTNQSQMQVFIPDGHGGGGTITIATASSSGQNVTMMGNGEFITAEGIPNLSQGQIVVFEIIPAEGNSHNIATAMGSANGVDTRETIQNPSETEGDDFVFARRIIHATFLP